jgi:hypothetical protein
MKFYLGPGRSGVGAATRAGDRDAKATAWTSVGLAKLGHGERGPRWLDEFKSAHLKRDRDALRELDAPSSRPSGDPRFPRPYL